MKFIPSTSHDIEQLTEWIKADPYHRDCLNPEWWLTGNGFLSFCVQDSKGPTMYARIDKEKDFMRLHIQFGPESEVSKQRVIKSILRGFGKIIELSKNEAMKGLAFRSTSPALIEFMKQKYGFKPNGEDDYLLAFEGGN